MTTIPTFSSITLTYTPTTHTATLTLGTATTPPGNLMGTAMWTEIPLAIAHAETLPDCRALILTGHGNHFTYGLNFTDLDPAIASLLTSPTPPDARSRHILLATIEHMQRAGNALANTPLPVIAAVEGWCIGGGMDLLAAADIRIAATSAHFSVRETKVGIVADMGSLARLPHIIGDGRTRDWALTGRDITAAEAHAAGLLSRIVDEGEALASAERAAADIAALPPLTVQGVKRVLNCAIEDQVASANRQVAWWNAAFLPSRDLQEAAQAVLGHRPPQFSGS